MTNTEVVKPEDSPFRIDHRDVPDSFRLIVDNAEVANDVDITTSPIEHAALLHTKWDGGDLRFSNAIEFKTERRFTLTVKAITVTWTPTPGTRASTTIELPHVFE